MENTSHEVHFSKAEDEFLKTPVHDTGSIWYTVLSFFLPIIGIIAAEVYKHKQYYHNYKACKKGAVIRFHCSWRDSADLPAGTASGCHKVAIWGGRSKIRIPGDRSRSKKSNFGKAYSSADISGDPAPGRCGGELYLCPDFLSQRRDRLEGY